MDSEGSSCKFETSLKSISGMTASILHTLSPVSARSVSLVAAFCRARNTRGKARSTLKLAEYYNETRRRIMTGGLMRWNEINVETWKNYTSSNTIVLPEVAHARRPFTCPIILTI